MSVLYAWVDIETTGLDPTRDSILEVALVVTDDELVEHTAISLVVNPELTPRWHAWRDRLDATTEVKKMHNKSGLAREITYGGISHREAERALIQTLERVGEPGGFVLAGSNVGKFDFAFLREQMPRLAEALDGRTFDVGSVRHILHTLDRHDLVPDLSNKAHRAMDDIQSHISEARIYREYLRLIPEMDS